MVHPTRRLSSSLLLVLLSFLLAPLVNAQQTPRFEVDPSWPKQLPNNWILSQIGGIAVDSHDHINFGHAGRGAGQLHWVHTMAIDSHGNLYTGDVDTGKRVQKFKRLRD